MSTKGCILTLSALLLAGLPSCIPSKPEAKQAEPQPQKVENTQAAVEKVPQPSNVEEHKDPHISTSKVEIPEQTPLDDDDEIANAEKMDEMMTVYDGVRTSTAPDGIGYLVEGPHGLKATLKPGANDSEWVFDGEFAIKTEGFQVGEAKVTGVSDGVPFVGQEVAMIPGVAMIAIPVVLPDVNAIETGDEYRTPVHFTLKAAPTAQFIISVMPVGSL